MIKATLQPLDSGQKPIEIPRGKTVIGRGPLLGCNDKKVSRNHAVLEVTDTGEVFLTPIHVNPCFYQANSESQAKTLKKEKAQKLSPGDIFSLLPASFRYKVLLGKEEADGIENDDKGKECSREESLSLLTTKSTDINQSSNNENGTKPTEDDVQNNGKDIININRTSDGIIPETKEEEEEENDRETLETKVSPQQQQREENKTADDGLNHNEGFKDEDRKKSSLRVNDDKEDKSPIDNSKDVSRPEQELKATRHMTEKEEAKDQESESNKKNNFQQLEQSSSAAKEETKVEKVVHAVPIILRPLRKKRTLPSWLLQLSESPSSKQPQQVPSFVKDKEELLRDPPKTTKRRRARGGGRQASTRSTASPAATSSSYQPKTPPSRRSRTYRDDTEDSIAKARCSRQNRQTRQRLSLDDFIVSDDDDWCSDTSSKRKSKGRRRRKKSDDSGSDWEVEHKKKRRNRRVETDSDSASDWEADKRKKKQTPVKGGRGRRKRKVAASDEEEELNEPSGSQEVKKNREACVYGKRCYRRNPQHFKEYSHPGDSDYTTDVEPDPPDANDERPECPYGVECYRKNAEHRKEFKHTKKIRPKREAAKKAAADQKRRDSDDDDDDDNDDGANNDDLNDRYSNGDESDEFQPGPESGSDWNPGNDSEEETVKAVGSSKSGKGHVVNKRTQKKV